MDVSYRCEIICKLDLSRIKMIEMIQPSLPETRRLDRPKIVGILYLGLKALPANRVLLSLCLNERQTSREHP